MRECTFETLGEQIYAFVEFREQEYEIYVRVTLENEGPVRIVRVSTYIDIIYIYI